MLTIDVTYPDGTTTRDSVAYRWVKNKDGALYIAIAAYDPFYGRICLRSDYVLDHRLDPTETVFRRQP